MKVRRKPLRITYAMLGGGRDPLKDSHANHGPVGLVLSLLLTTVVGAKGSNPTQKTYKVLCQSNKLPSDLFAPTDNRHIQQGRCNSYPSWIKQDASRSRHSWLDVSELDGQWA